MTRSRPRQRRLRAAFLAVAVVFSAVPSRITYADHQDGAAEQAAREIQEARDRANAAAQAVFDAESRIDELELDIAESERRLTELEAETASMRAALTEVAVRRYVSGELTSNPLLTPIEDVSDRNTANVLAAAAAGSAVVDVDSFNAKQAELEALQESLTSDREAVLAARAGYAQLQDDAEAEIVRLQEIEEERLRDEAVQHALDQQRREREEAAQAEREQAEREQAERQQRQELATRSDDNDDPSNDGAGAAPAPPPPPDPPRAAIVCPVAGAVGFADTWGAPRSGGRGHEGVDMMAGPGTPLVAAEAGTVTFKTNRLGGNVVWLSGVSGTKYYYAHLSAWEGSSRGVSPGEVIGYVGMTGNAPVNHLHFEVHPGGGRAINPYPYVRAAC